MTVFRFERRRLLIRNGIVVAIIGVWALSGDVIGISLFVVLAATTAWSLRRPRLVVTDEGITVANLVVTRRIAWNDITGFGYGEYRRSWCVEVQLSDGAKVPVRVLSDNLDTGGNPSGRVSSIVAELRHRLATVSGIRDSPSKVIDAGDGTAFDEEYLAGADVRHRRATRQLKWLYICTTLLGFFFIGLGINTIAGTAQRPHTYARLRAHGVQLDARFEGCGHVDRFDKNTQDDVCRLSVTYRGRTRTWDYQDNYPQFDHLAVGAPVPVLLDPTHPTTVYTVDDVNTNDNAGVLSVLGLFGVAAVLGGLGILIWIGKSALQMRRESHSLEVKSAAA